MQFDGRNCCCWWILLNIIFIIRQVKFYGTCQKRKSNGLQTHLYIRLEVMWGDGMELFRQRKPQENMNQAPSTLLILSTVGYILVYCSSHSQVIFLAICCSSRDTRMVNVKTEFEAEFKPEFARLNNNGLHFTRWIMKMVF